MSEWAIHLKNKRFAQKNEWFAKKNSDLLEKTSDSLKKTSDSLIFGEQPEWFAHVAHFLVSDLSDFLTPLIKKEGMIASFFFKLTKNGQKTILVSDSLICSFIMSDLSKSHTVALL